MPSSVGFASYEPLDAGHSTPASQEPDEHFRLSDIAKLVRRTRRRIIGAARADERVTFRTLLLDHLGCEPSTLDVTRESWPGYDHVNVQTGLDAWLTSGGREHHIIGVVNFRHRDFGLSEMVQTGGRNEAYGTAPGNVSRANLPIGPSGQVRPCVVCAVYLVRDGGRRAAMLLRMGDPDTGRMNTSLEITADDPSYSAEIAADVRALALEHNVYRGQVVSFGHDMFGERSGALSFHERQPMRAEDLILPASVMDAVTRQVVGVAKHRGRLLAAGQHLKRGVLLYGPPGVGKTHTARYLISQLTDTTIVQLSGHTLGMIGMACSVARTLQPALIVIEDVDLIAEERGSYPGEHPMLFQLLNEMDGLAEDADVVFLLTTNRVDVLEPALTQRPGRVDQAVELGLPDVDARRRLFALYRGTLDVDESRLGAVIERTEGVTASFLKELLRRSALRAAEAEGGDTRLRVSADQLDAALDDLLDTRNAMTRVLLGGASSATRGDFVRADAGQGAERLVARALPAVQPTVDDR